MKLPYIVVYLCQSNRSNDDENCFINKVLGYLRKMWRRKWRRKQSFIICGVAALMDVEFEWLIDVLYFFINFRHKKKEYWESIHLLHQFTIQRQAHWALEWSTSSSSSSCLILSTETMKCSYFIVMSSHLRLTYSKIEEILFSHLTLLSVCSWSWCSSWCWWDDCKRFNNIELDLIELWEINEVVYGEVLRIGIDKKVNYGNLNDMYVDCCTD